MKKVVITGANRGIGLGLTKVFLSENHQVIAATRNPKESSYLLDLKKKYSQTLDIVALDVTKKHSISKFYPHYFTAELAVTAAPASRRIRELRP